MMKISYIIFLLFICLVIFSEGSGFPLKKKETEDKVEHFAFPKKIRGINISSRYLDEKVVETVLNWNVNAIRINLHPNRDFSTGIDLVHPLKEYSKSLENFAKILPICEKKHLGIILSLSSGQSENNLGYFWNQKTKSIDKLKLEVVWQALANQYKKTKAIIGYDLYNEPSPKSMNNTIWTNEIIPSLLYLIRSIDKNVDLIIESFNWAYPASMKNMKTYKYKNIIYSIHHYAPGIFTHQGVGKLREQFKGKVKYPGYILPSMKAIVPIFWDKQELKNRFKDVLEFQKKNNIRILVGEFGVARWANGKELWIKDSISLFEEYGWDWCFHSYSGWNGWNPTFKSSDPISVKPNGGHLTKTLEILINEFSKNK